jgi:hypothetical protein
MLLGHLLGVLMLFQTILLALRLLILSLLGLASAHAEAVGQLGNQKTVSIANNSGGNIAVFALAAAEYQSAGTLVKFNGRCDSACTLFLGLPSKQTCISQGAFFRFHAPFGVSAKSQKTAHAYLMRKYPKWVRTWIASQNGLSRNLITMDYSHARKFIRSCDAIASR